MLITFYTFLFAAAILYASIYAFLRRLKIEKPEVFQELGAPGAWQVFSRYPGNWRIQLRFYKFVLSGAAIYKTKGFTKILAGIIFIAQIFLYMAVALMIRDIYFHD